VISDEFLQFIPKSLFELRLGLEFWSGEWGELESDVDGKMVGAQAWEGAPFTCGG